MSSAVGSFPYVSPGTTETGQIGGSGSQLANTFTLQLNTSFFTPLPSSGSTTTLCSSSGTPSQCLGWEQFVFSTSVGSTGGVFIQYWLINYNATCPSGWGSTPLAPGDCYMNGPSNSASDLTGSPLTAAGLANVTMEGTASLGGQDTVILTNGGTAVANSTNSDSIFNLAKSWNTAQFDVFGDGGGGEANFSAGTTLQVMTATNSGTPAAPSCVEEGFTAESNNLNLVGTPASLAGSSPAIISEQSNSETTAASCVTAPLPGSTTTTLTSSPDPSTFGQPVTLTATVSPSDGGGTVAFDVDGSPVPGCGAQSLTLVAGSYQATCVTSGLAPGTHAVSATYSGDNGYAGSSGSLAGGQVVDQIPTTTIVTSSPDPSIFGKPVTLTAIEIPSDGIGTVAFDADGSPIPGCATQGLNLVAGNWQATCVTTGLAPGTHAITATSTGDTDYGGSSGSLAGGQVVDRVPTSTSLASSINPSVHHQPVTFTATVTPTDGSGTVAFAAGGTVVPSCGAQLLALVGGKEQATCTDASLAVGTDVVTAAYSGDTDYLPSTSAALAQKVKAHGAPAFVTPTKGTPQSAPAGSKFGQPLTALVTDLWGNAVPGVVVDFAAPFTGPSATFDSGLSSQTAVTGSNGQATTPYLTADPTVGGPYDVVASAGALSGDFMLTNLTPLPDVSITSYGSDLTVNGHTQSTILNSIANTGDVPTTGKLTVTDELPPGITFTGKNRGAGWSCKYAGGVTATCTTTDAIPVGGTDALNLDVDVTAPAGTWLTIYTNVAPADTTPSDNTDIIQVQAGTF